MTGMILASVPRRWPGATVVVAATGPSLTPEVAAQCREHHAIAVNDAWRLLPWADVLYAADAPWWTVHHGVPDFGGERWSAHDTANNDKRHIAERYGLRLVAGKAGDTFSTDPRVIHYAGNSGFQAIGLAILFGAARVVLVGFDMRIVAGKRHFFGNHVAPLRNSIDYRYFVPAFKNAARHLPPGIEIVNATPSSALDCFPFVPLDRALAPRAGTRETAAA